MVITLSTGRKSASLRFWATNVVPSYYGALLFFLAAMVLGVAPANVVFSGFASGAVWLVFGGIIIGQSVRQTGLDVRLVHTFLSHFPNALLPIITLAGLQAGQMVGGGILTETVFAWPGIGRLMFEALQQRDYNLLLGIFFFSAALVIVFNIITDLVYSLADPRIKKGAA